MSQQFSQFSESSKINQEFRKEIRRKDIDRRLAERRKMLMQMEINGYNQEINTDAALLKNQLQEIYQVWQYSGGKFAIKELRELAKISCGLAGAQGILGYPKQLFESLINQFIISQKYDDAQQLDYSLLILNNLLTVSTPPCSTSSSSSSTLISPNLSLLALSSSPTFLQRIFFIVLHASKASIKQYSISIIFDIVYNSDSSFVHNLIVNSKFAIMSLLYNIMCAEPGKVIVIQVLRCFYLLVKKVGFGAYDQFGRLRKFINAVIKNSNCLQMFIIGVVCLQALLRALPAQRSLFSKSSTLEILLSQTLFYKNQRLTMHTLRICSLLLENKSEEECSKILKFIEKCLQQFQEVQIQKCCLKILYDIIVNGLYPVDRLFVADQPSQQGQQGQQSQQSQQEQQMGGALLNKILEKLEDNRVDRGVIVEICFCLAVISAKSKKIEKGLVERIKSRVEGILQNWDLSQQTAKLLQQSLQILNIDNSME